MKALDARGVDPAIAFDLLIEARRKEMAKPKPGKRKPSAAVAAGEAGMEAVKQADPDWHARTLTQIKQMAAGFEGTFEALRVKLEESGWPAPHHHNAWGSVARAAKLEGYLIGTGTYKPMETVRSHGRTSEVLKGWRQELRTIIAEGDAVTVETAPQA